MPYTEEGKILINNLFSLKEYNVSIWLASFPAKARM